MVNQKKIVIGIRDSKLSNVQTEEFISFAHNNIEGINADSFEIKHIKTTGDIKNSERLDKIGGKGLFIREIEESILSGEIDIGVHSMKDIPAVNQSDLEICCYMPRIESSDVFISNSGKTLKEIESGSIIGTSSIRRRAQLLNSRQDLNIKLLRGNVDTRLKKLKNKEYDGIILAHAGLKRLNLESEITEVFDHKYFLPPGGQGCVGIQSLSKSSYRDMFKSINCKDTETIICAERDVLKTINANCNSPVSVAATIINQFIQIRCQIFMHNGEMIFDEMIQEKRDQSQDIGKNLGKLAIQKLGQKTIDRLDELSDDFNYSP